MKEISVELVSILKSIFKVIGKEFKAITNKFRDKFK